MNLMPDLIAALDNGTSNSKTLWQQYPDGAVELLLMGSEILEVTAHDLLDTGLSGGRPENDAFIQFPDGKLFVLGMRAQSMKGKPPLKMSKYAPAAYKIVAMLGAIAQTANLPNAFSVCLSTLLPYVEYQDRERFIELLVSYLHHFEFRGIPYQVTVESLDVRPEGAGLAQNHRSTAPTVFDQQNTLILMLGQRDASLLPFKQGTPQQGTTEHLGFAEFQQDVVLRAALNISVRDTARLPEYLFKSRQEQVYIERIARMVVTESELAHKVTQLQEAIAQAQVRYLSNLFTWIKTTLGQDLYEVDQLVISGGAALYFQTELEEFFANYHNLKLVWQQDIQEQMSSALAAAIDPALAFRMSDVYGSFRVLANKVKKLEAQLKPPLPANKPEIAAPVVTPLVNGSAPAAPVDAPEAIAATVAAEPQKKTRSTTTRSKTKPA
jgi:hypothetical protein